MKMDREVEYGYYRSGAIVVIVALVALGPKIRDIFTNAGNVIDENMTSGSASVAG